ncbi:CRE-MPK-2 protein [Caenorhabditis remanei]|uniref:Mitogen-activated protein kinase n=1 Tax=Caenorhabditis remanei TaxID=31234 RepID=E3M4F0_CAERE|nr:CRE-MPK-2 protein [Caenorhabditis remanei]
MSAKTTARVSSLYRAPNYYSKKISQENNNYQKEKKMAAPAEAHARLDGRFWLEGTPYLAEENVGAGAYGVVCKAMDTRIKKQVAIKKIPRAFTAHTLAKRSLREVRILRELLHENIIAVLDMFTAEGAHGKDIYLVMDLMETDLHQILHSRQTLMEQHFQYFFYQLLRGLKYLHSAGIIHRDLKPSNLLLNGDCLLRIADFGMARACASASTVRDDANVGGHMTQYVSTRWYRAPEILFSMVEYDTKVDLWSAGCIFAEMLLRRQLFPGKDSVSQIKMIVYYLGNPEDEVINKISSQLVKDSIDACGRKTPLPFSAIFPKASPEARDMVSYLLQISPWRRYSADQILQHPFMAQYHNEQYEPLCPPRVQVDVDAIEKYEGPEVVAGLDEEARIFEMRRGTNYDTRKEPPPYLDEQSNQIFEPDKEGKMGPREDPTDYLGVLRQFEKTRETKIDDEDIYDSDETPTSLSSAETIDTVREVEIHRKDSEENTSTDSGMEPSTSNLMVQEIFQNGINWPLDVASTSSAPPMLSGGIPAAKKSRNLPDRRNIDKIREGYSEKRRFIPKIRDKRASSDSSSKLDDKDRIVRLRKSRQELRKTSKDDDRGA